MTARTAARIAGAVALGVAALAGCDLARDNVRRQLHPSKTFKQKTRGLLVGDAP